jgi:hypothetical protein
LGTSGEKWAAGIFEKEGKKKNLARNTFIN